MRIVELLIAFVAILWTVQAEWQPPHRAYRDIEAQEELVPFLFCDVCKRVVRQLTLMQQHVSPGQKKTETRLLDFMTNLCDPLEDEGFWITHLDVVNLPDKIGIKRMSGPGWCEEDCKTVALTCKTVIDTGDAEIAEALYLNKSDTTPQSICSAAPFDKVKGGCGQPYPPMVKEAVVYDFKHKTKEDFEREQYLAEKALSGDESPEIGQPLGGEILDGTGQLDLGKVGITPVDEL